MEATYPFETLVSLQTARRYNPKTILIIATSMRTSNTKFPLVVLKIFLVKGIDRRRILRSPVGWPERRWLSRILEKRKESVSNRRRKPM
jgi:hypothetical protein